jgi:hypothetical protein
MRVAAPLVLRNGDQQKLAKMASSRIGEAGAGAAGADCAAGRSGAGAYRGRRAVRDLGAHGAPLAVPVCGRGDQGAGRPAPVRSA